MTVPLGRTEIQALLEDLDRELERRGATADLFLVGGAAIAVAYDIRRATRDLDAVFERQRRSGKRHGAWQRRGAWTTTG